MRSVDNHDLDLRHRNRDVRRCLPEEHVTVAANPYFRKLRSFGSLAAMILAQCDAADSSILEILSCSHKHRLIAASD